MASIETLIVQLFDRKRQIIDQLKQHNLIYDQHLASKLFIHGISPPSWLLPDHFPELDKAGLISGLLHPRPGRVSACPGNHGYLYDKTVSVVNNSVINGACSGNCASSTACDEDASSVIPVCNDDVTDDRAAIVAPSHVENIACAPIYAPMSPENHYDTSICDTHPKQEQSLVKIQRSRSRQKALETRSAKTSSKSRLGITNNVGTTSQNNSFQCDVEKESTRVRSPTVSNCLLTQFTNNEVEVHTGDDHKKERNNRVYVSSITRSSNQHQQSNSAQFANNEVEEVHTGDHQKKEMNSSVYVGRITRSSSNLSGSKALEHDAELDGSKGLIESDKDSALTTDFLSLEDEIMTSSAKKNCDAPCVSLLRDLTTNNNGGSPSENKICEGDEEANGSIKSLELAKPFSASTKICYTKELPIKMSSPDSYAELSTLLTNNEAKAVYGGDNLETEKRDILYAGRITRSKSVCQQPADVSSGSQRQYCSEQLRGSRGFIESHKPFELPATICLSESGDAGNASLSIDLEINNNVNVPSGNDNSQGDEQLNDIRESFELEEAFSIPTKTCNEEEALTMLAKSSSRCQLFKDASSGSKTLGSSDQFCDSRESLRPYKLSASPTKICSWKPADVGPCLTKESCDASDGSLTKSADSNAKDEKTRNIMEKKSSSFSGDRLTAFASSCQSSLGIPSTTKTSGDGPKIDDIREFVDLVKQIAAPMGIYSQEEEETQKSIPEMQPYEDSGRNVLITMTANEQSPASGLLIDQQRTLGEPSDCYCLELEVETEPDCSELYEATVSGQVVADCNFSGPLPSNSKERDCENFRQAVKKLTFSTVSPMIERRDFDEVDPAMPGHKQLPASGLSVDKQRYFVEPSDCYSKKLEVQTELGSAKLCGATLIDMVNGQVVADGNFCGPVPAITKEKDCESSLQTVKRLKLSTVSPVIECTDFVEVDPAMPGHKQLPASSLSMDKQEIFAEPSDSYLRELEVETELGCAELYGATVSGMVNGQGVADNNFPGPLLAISKKKDCESSLQPVKGLKFSTVSPVIVCMDVDEADKAMPGHKQIPTHGLSIDQQSTFVEPSDCHSKELKDETEQGFAEVYGATVNGMVNGQVVADSSFSKPSPSIYKEKDCENSLQAVKKLKFSTVSPVFECMDVDEADKVMPEYESFGAQNFGDKFLYDDFPLPSNTMEQSSLHELISRSACFSTSVLPFPATCNLRLEPGIYSSVPNGVLENIGMSSNLLPVGSALQRKSHSDLFSFPHNQCGQDLRKPFLSPVKIGFESMTSKSCGSEKVRSGNPELICFTIVEDPESSEEDVNEVKTGVEETSLKKKSTSIRDPLCDITVKNNTSLVRDDAVEKRSIESISTDSSVSEICDLDSQVNGTSRRQTRQTTRGNENKGFSVGGSTFKKNSKALSSRFSKPKLSGQSNLRDRGQSLSEKEPKRNNIVSNVKSFIPLVQQKQAAAAAPVKRAVKVKALEAAEAAKLLAEKKENERKQKKEAQKAERARLEQENLKQLELAKKLKEQAKKKREAENAAKKRQREDEEKNDKERKRKRVEDARCQQKQAQEKIHAWREESRYGAEEERTLEEKERHVSAQKNLYTEYETRVSSKPVNEVACASIKMKAGDGLPTLSDNVFTGPSLIGKVDSVLTAESTTPNPTKSNEPTSRNSEEQSYDISPYHCSDDEGEEDEDEMPNKKFIPSWASKSCISLALSSLQHMDPESIFPPGSFCSLDEVLVPKRLPLISKK